MIMHVLLCYSGRDQPVPPTTKPGTAYIYSNYYLYNHQCFLLDSPKFNLHVCVCVGVGGGGAFIHVCDSNWRVMVALFEFIHDGKSPLQQTVAELAYLLSNASCLEVLDLVY